MTEQAPLGVAVLVLGEVLEWAVPDGEEWVAPEPVQNWAENASALGAGLLFPMRLEFPAPTRSAQNAGQR